MVADALGIIGSRGNSTPVQPHEPLAFETTNGAAPLLVKLKVAVMGVPCWILPKSCCVSTQLNAGKLLLKANNDVAKAKTVSENTRVNFFIFLIVLSDTFFR